MTKKIKLPKSGFTIEIKDIINIAVFRGYQAIMMKDANMDISSRNANPEVKLNLTSVYKGQDFVLRNILVALYDKEGNKLEPVEEKFNELPTEDGNLIYDEVDKLIASASVNPLQKKSGKELVSSGMKT